MSPRRARLAGLVTRVAVVGVIALAWIACAQRPAPGGSGEAPPVVTAPGRATASPAPTPADAIGCKSAADCPRLACGPCTPGTPITRDLLGGPSCFRNPCRNAESACEAGRCVVGPKTEKDPAVFGADK
jgi:hypothetical protein